MSEFFMNHKKEPQEEYNVQEPNEIVACFIDWLVVGGHGFLMTLGLQASGDLILLHISRSRLNDVQATHLHLETLCAMGHKPKKPMLFVVNGSTCLRHLVPGILGEFVVIQRCQMRCAKDLMQSVPAEKAKNIEPQFQEFFELTYSSSQAKVKDWGKEFEENFPAVAANFMENSEETMTINRMEVPMPLRITLSTTSMIWQQPPGFMAELEKAVKEGLPDGSLLKLKTLFKKRLKELSPIVGFADIWLLKPALKEEVKLLRPDLVDYRDLLAENNEEEKKPIILSRRKHKRMIVKGLQCIIQHTIEANVLNMSMSGLTSQTHLPLKIGELHHIRLRHNKGEARLIGKLFGVDSSFPKRKNIRPVKWSIYRAFNLKMLSMHKIMKGICSMTAWPKLISTEGSLADLRQNQQMTMLNRKKEKSGFPSGFYKSAFRGS